MKSYTEVSKNKISAAQAKKDGTTKNTINSIANTAVDIGVGAIVGVVTGGLGLSIRASTLIGGATTIGSLPFKPFKDDYHYEAGTYYTVIALYENEFGDQFSREIITSNRKNSDYNGGFIAH